MNINTAFILCAGFGKRLKPITLETPKPLIKIDDYFNDNIVYDTDLMQRSFKDNYKSNVFLCGGYMSDSSIEGAVLSSNKLASHLVKN